jgi:multicomponent Na+:H+ antiporter subunit E
MKFLLKTIIKVPRILTFLGFYLLEMIRSNLRVAYDILTPRHRMKPGIIAIPLEKASPLETVLLSNLITMTPGTLLLDLSEDGRTMYVHAMYIDNQEELRAQLKDEIEKRVLEILR